MVRKKICKEGFLLGYWKKEFVALPIPYAPDNKTSDCTVEERLVPKNMLFPRLIDIKTTSLAEIMAICEFNDRPFWWITGIDPRDPKAIQLAPQDPLEKGIQYFIAFNVKGSIQNQYERYFNYLKNIKILKRNMTVEEFQEEYDEIRKRVGELRRKKDNTPIFFMLNRLKKFLIRPIPIAEKKRTHEYEPKVKDPLKPEEAEKFFSALIAINPVHELIGRILWYYNYEMYVTDGVDPNKGPMIPLELIRKIKSENVSCEDNIIDILSNTTNYKGWFMFRLPEELFARVRELKEKTHLFIFQNRRGAPIDPSQIRKSFVEASKQSMPPGRIITPKHLR
jgi:hypothetical protein